MEGDLVPLEQFDYGNKKLGCLLQESMDEVFFLGVTVSHATVSHEGMMVIAPVRNEDTSMNRTAGTPLTEEVGHGHVNHARMQLWRRGLHTRAFDLLWSLSSSIQLQYVSTSELCR